MNDLNVRVLSKSHKVDIENYSWAARQNISQNLNKLIKEKRTSVAINN